MGEKGTPGIEGVKGEKVSQLLFKIFLQIIVLFFKHRA